MRILARKTRVPVVVLLLFMATVLGGCLPASWNPWREKNVSVVNQVPETTTWCYQTLADADCYATPQNLPADRLINVQPQSRYPSTAEEYRKTLVRNE